MNFGDGVGISDHICSVSTQLNMKFIAHGKSAILVHYLYSLSILLLAWNLKLTAAGAKIAPAEVFMEKNGLSFCSLLLCQVLAWLPPPYHVPASFYPSWGLLCVACRNCILGFIQVFWNRVSFLGITLNFFFLIPVMHIARVSHLKKALQTDYLWICFYYQNITILYNFYVVQTD